jgi:lysophospholipase L1-like esterase
VRRAAVRALGALAAVVLTAACSPGTTTGAAGEEPRPSPGAGAPLPGSLAALGDSITRGVGACDRVGECPEVSWATGTAVGLDSVAQRLGAQQGEALSVHNLAVSGATVGGLAPQVEAAAELGVDAVTVLVGANDACAASEQAMTPVERFAADFDEALEALVTALPGAQVYVVSIPDLGRLWEVGRDQPAALQVWERFGVCRTALGDAIDDGPEAQGRRARVRERVLAYNAAMAQACAARATCAGDGGAVFDDAFPLDAVSPVDFFHPSAEGQRALAEVAWAAGPWAGRS